MIFEYLPLTTSDEMVIEEIERLRHELSGYVNVNPRRWVGHLRRMSLARAVRGSNWIEGYRASLDDVLDTLEDEEPRDAGVETRMALAGYRDALTYILQLSATDTKVDESLIRALHFMMIKHDLNKGPGSYRPGAVWVEDEEGNHVYEAPNVELVPDLLEELVAEVNADVEMPAMVRAALAHLNLVMIHPFRDGNGRMARALQTFVLAREGIVSPVFSSIEEYLGHNTDDYYEVLANVGQGAWNPDRSSQPWIRFNLTAHYRQAWTIRRRVDETESLYDSLEQLIVAEGLPPRTVGPLADAARGRRLRRSTYLHLVELTAGEPISNLSASRDLRVLVDAGILEASGQTRGRVYVGSQILRKLWLEIRASRPQMSQDDPYVTFGGQQTLPGLKA